MKNFYAILTFLFLVSCSTSSDVVQHGFIQKRKYTKGFTHHKKDRSLFNKNSFSINKKTNEIANNNHTQLKKLQSEVTSVTSKPLKKTPEAIPLVASNNNDILINTDELVKENYFIKNDISELIKIKNKPFKKIRAIKEIIELTNDGDEEVKDKSKRNFIYNLLVPGLGTILNGEIGLGILQLLLFAGGIFGAYWIFWNTSINTIFPILISVLAFGWSFLSGYNQISQEQILSTEEISIVKENIEVNSKQSADPNKISASKKEQTKNDVTNTAKSKFVALKNQNIELKKLREEALKIPELDKLNKEILKNVAVSSTCYLLGSIFAIPCIIISIFFLLLGGFDGDPLLFLLATVPLLFLIMLFSIGLNRGLKAGKLTSKLNKKIIDFKNKKSNP